MERDLPPKEMIESLLNGDLSLPFTDRFQLPEIVSCPGGCEEEKYCRFKKFLSLCLIVVMLVPFSNYLKEHYRLLYFGIVILIFNKYYACHLASGSPCWIWILNLFVWSFLILKKTMFKVNVMNAAWYFLGSEVVMELKYQFILNMHFIFIIFFVVANHVQMLIGRLTILYFVQALVTSKARHFSSLQNMLMVWICTRHFCADFLFCRK